MSIRYRRNPDATERRIGDSLFLANPEFDSLYRLNETVGALWSLLEQPTTIDEAIEVFQAAFPDKPEDEIQEHATEMFLDLIEEGLAEPDT
ncbi:MAG: PqqD family protein [bacterium]|nr:PqqD family protein [bacterium]